MICKCDKVLPVNDRKPAGATVAVLLRTMRLTYFSYQWYYWLSGVFVLIACTKYVIFRRTCPFVELVPWLIESTRPSDEVLLELLYFLKCEVSRMATCLTRRCC